MTVLEAKIIVALAKHNLRAVPAAKETFMSRNTLCYHVDKIRENTGLDPFNFYDMEWLIAKAKMTLGMYGTFVLNGGVTND